MFTLAASLPARFKSGYHPCALIYYNKTFWRTPPTVDRVCFPVGGTLSVSCSPMPNRYLATWYYPARNSKLCIPWAMERGVVILGSPPGHLTLLFTVLQPIYIYLPPSPWSTLTQIFNQEARVCGAVWWRSEMERPSESERLIIRPATLRGGGVLALRRRTNVPPVLP